MSQIATGQTGRKEAARRDPRRLPALRTGIAVVVLVGFGAYHLYNGTQSTANSAYTSSVGVFGEYTHGVIRFVFPFIATLLAAVPVLDEVTENFIAFTRTRQRLGARIRNWLLLGFARNAVYFGALGLLTTVAASYVAPAVNHGIVDPHAFGLTPAEALRQVAGQDPLGAAAAAGAIVYGLLATLWMVLGSCVFALAAVASALIFSRRLLAFVAPLGVFVVEGIAAQLVGWPQLSLLSELPTPSGLQSFPLFLAVIPGLVIAMASAVSIVVMVRRAGSTGRFS